MPSHLTMGILQLVAKLLRQISGESRASCSRSKSCHFPCCQSLSQLQNLCVCMYKIISRSEEHTSELQSRENLVCRLLLEKQKPRRGPGCASGADRRALRHRVGTCRGRGAA